MTPSMWLTLVAAVGMAILALTVVRSRHPLALPLGFLIANMLLWNLAWLAFVLSGDDRWRWACQCVASLVPIAGLEFVLTFVGRRRELMGVTKTAYAFFVMTTASCASRYLLRGDELYVGDGVWWRLVVGGGAAVSAVIGWLLIHHYRIHRRNRDGAERAHTRLLMIGFVLWTVLSATDLVHRRFALVPQMSGVGMLICVALMAVVMDRVRPNGPSRWWTLYTIALFVVALSAHVVVFKALPVTTAMLFARTLLLVGVGVAATREVVVIMALRRRRMAELALIGRVTAQMAHDLKNPLAAIRCAAQVLAEDEARGRLMLHGDRQGRMLALIDDQTTRLTDIVDDYRRLGRIEPRAQPVALGDLVRRVASPNHDVRLDLQVRHVPECNVDPELFARAMDNLVRNATEAMPDGGTITVRAHIVGADWVDVVVSDDGCGMDARLRERAFDDFFTTKTQGSGLGLAFVRRVAEAHGGHARLESRLGHGTRVTVRIPCARSVDLPFTTGVRAAA